MELRDTIKKLAELAEGGEAAPATVNEAISIQADGVEAMALLMKLSGIAAAPAPEPVEEEFANTPHEQEIPVPPGNDLHREKQAFVKANGGDNAMAIEAMEGKLAKMLEDTSIKPVSKPGYTPTSGKANTALPKSDYDDFSFGTKTQDKLPQDPEAGMASGTASTPKNRSTTAIKRTNEAPMDDISNYAKDTFNLGKDAVDSGSAPAMFKTIAQKGVDAFNNPANQKYIDTAKDVAGKAASAYGTFLDTPMGMMMDPTLATAKKAYDIGQYFGDKKTDLSGPDDFRAPPPAAKMPDDFRAPPANQMATKNDPLSKTVDTSKITSLPMKSASKPAYGMEDDYIEFPDEPGVKYYKTADGTGYAKNTADDFRDTTPKFTTNLPTGSSGSSSGQGSRYVTPIYPDDAEPASTATPKMSSGALYKPSAKVSDKSLKDMFSNNDEQLSNDEINRLLKLSGQK